MACSLTLRPICCLDSAINAGAIWAGEVLISGGDLSIADSKASTENGGQGRGRGGEGRGGEGRGGLGRGITRRQPFQPAVGPSSDRLESPTPQVKTVT